MKKPKEMESIAIKRATIADADKVRYRVYRDATDFVAVIAESALMAMKASGINEPYRIVRDLPTEGISIEAKRMAKMGGETVSFPIVREEKNEVPSNGFRKAEITDKTVPLDSKFVPMAVADLKKTVSNWARVLTPEMVENIRAKQQAATPKVEAAPPPPPPAPEPVMEEEILPPVMETAHEPEPMLQEAAQSGGQPGVLSEEEVARLMNS